MGLEFFILKASDHILVGHNQEIVVHTKLEKRSNLETNMNTKNKFGNKFKIDIIFMLLYTIDNQTGRAKRAFTIRPARGGNSQQKVGKVDPKKWALTEMIFLWLFSLKSAIFKVENCLFFNLNLPGWFWKYYIFLELLPSEKSKILKVALYITRNLWFLDPPPALIFLDMILSSSFPVRTWNALLKPARLVLKILYLLGVIALGKVEDSQSCPLYNATFQNCWPTPCDHFFR